MGLWLRASHALNLVSISLHQPSNLGHVAWVLWPKHTKPTSRNKGWSETAYASVCFLRMEGGSFGVRNSGHLELLPYAWLWCCKVGFDIGKNQNQITCVKAQLVEWSGFPWTNMAHPWANVGKDWWRQSSSVELCVHGSIYRFVSVHRACENWGKTKQAWEKEKTREPMWRKGGKGILGLMWFGVSGLIWTRKLDLGNRPWFGPKNNTKNNNKK